jgi:hypothetical protein
MKKKPLLQKIYHKARRVYMRFFYGVFSDPQNTDLSFAVIGRLNFGRLYLKQYLGSEKFKLSRQYFSNNNATQTKLTDKHGMVVITERMLLKSPVENALMVPDLVWLYIPLPATFDEYRNALPKSARSDLSRIKREGYTHAIINDEPWAKTFFKDYHAPAMQNRHNKMAYITEQGDLEEQIRRPGSEFINIYLNGTCVASMLTTISDGKYTLSQMGWLNGEPTLVHSGAVAALYWQAIIRAFELGCSRIILGGTPAHIDNGVVTFKGKWGARISDEKFLNITYLLLNAANIDCYAFLTKVSLIAIGKANKLILLTSKRPDELKVKGSVLKDISVWYVLRDSKADRPCDDELPPDLSCWYDKFPIT